MIIICEECETAYNLDDSLIDEGGSKVRCTKCRREFMAYPLHVGEEAGSDLETADDPAPGAEEDSLGLLNTEPMPVDFDDEAGSTYGEAASEIGSAAAEIETELALEEGEWALETDDAPEVQENGGLPAFEDLEDFDCAFLAEEEEPAADEPAGPGTELLLEAEMAEPEDAGAGGPQEDTLNLSDIEDLVDSGEFPGAIEPAETDAEDGEPLLEPQEGESVEEIDFNGVEEGSEKIDVSDLKEIPAEDEAPAPEAPLFEEDGEPELVFEGLFETTASGDTAETAYATGAVAADSDSEPEIEIFLGPEGEFTPGGEPAPTGEFVPEISFAEAQPDDSAGGTDTDGHAFGPGWETSEKTDVIEGSSTVSDSPLRKPPAPVPPPACKRGKRFLAAAAALLLAAGLVIMGPLAGIRVADVTALVKRVPLAGDFLVPEKADRAGNLRILPLEETVFGKFIHNPSAGKLFVIKGRVRNGYDHRRSHIKITGRLYQKGSRLSKTARVYCGNILSDAELEAMDMGVINRRLDNRRGDEGSNLKVRSGRSIPFMIVFNHLPDNLDEYAIEVHSSSG